MQMKDSKIDGSSKEVIMFLNTTEPRLVQES